MTFRDLPELIRPAPPLAADDTVGKAIRLLRARGLPALPVAQGGRLIGMVQDEALVALAVAQGPTSEPGAVAAAVSVAQVMQPMALIVNENAEIASTIRVLQEQNASSAPVAAEDGRYLGLVLRRDLLAVLLGQPAPPPIAGLATPFGVHLTTGTFRAGANDLSLAATGVALMAIYLLSNGLMIGLEELAGRVLGQAAGLPYRLGPGALANAVLVGTVAKYLLQMAVFLLLLRLSPLTGIHAAEHMVVRAVEEGEDLTLEKVRAMARVHPRCGTNLMALFTLLMIGAQLLFSMKAAMGSGAWLSVFLLLAMIILLTWRRLGAGLQRWVTTRRPSDRQLGKAIEVGKALLAKVRRQPGARSAVVRRIWNAGFLQVTAGFMAVAALVEYVWPLLVPFQVP